MITTSTQSLTLIPVQSVAIWSWIFFNAENFVWQMLVCVLHPGCKYSSLKEEMEVKKLGNQLLCLEGPLPAMASCVLPFDMRRGQVPCDSFSAFSLAQCLNSSQALPSQIKACSYWYVWYLNEICYRKSRSWQGLNLLNILHWYSW